MNIPVHRNTDSRSCGAQTTVSGQANVFVNNLLASVQGDRSTHGDGALGATVNDGTVYLNNKKLVLKGSNASPDSLCAPRGGQHCNPKSVGASSNVFACGGGSGGSIGGSPDEAMADPSRSDLYPDPNAADLDAEETGVRNNETDPSSDGDTNTGDVGAPSADAIEREQQAFDYFVSQGYTREQAAGMVGNLTRESSGVNPTAINPNDAGPGLDSEGIAQWNRERLDNLQNFAADRGTTYQDFETQLAFVDHELRGSGANGGGSEAAAYNRLKSTSDPRSAAEAFSKYERYQGHQLGLQGGETQRRAAEAERILGNN